MFVYNIQKLCIQDSFIVIRVLIFDVFKEPCELSFPMVFLNLNRMRTTAPRMIQYFQRYRSFIMRKCFIITLVSATNRYQRLHL